MKKLQSKPYWNPYFAGLMLGLLLLITFFIMGRGLGASGGEMRLVTYILSLVSPEHAQANPYFAKYLKGGSPLKAWLVFEILGVLFGGFLSGYIHGRLGFKTDHGPRISNKGRWLLAFLGGMTMGIGARIARGCTSGQGLTGGATLSLGSWIFLWVMFIAAYAFAYFLRKQWI